MTEPLIFLDPFPRNEAMVYTPDTAEALARMGRVVTHFGSRAPDDLVEQNLAEMIVLVGQTAMPKERLDRAPNLRAILNVKANWEPNIDYAEAAARGIHVLSAAPAMAPAVAEFCIGQAIALARGLPQANALFRTGREKYGIAGNGRAVSLYDAPVGLIGYGNLGRELVPLLRPFTRDIAVHDPWLSDGYLATQGVRPVALDALLAQSRVIFILAGVTSENEGFLDAASLGRIGEDALVILASRAEVVDFDALLAEAASERLRVAIDVFPEEPAPADHPARNTPNVLFTAHLAGGLAPSYARIREMMLDDIGQILKGLPPLRMQRADPGLAAKMRSR
ncbi:NAD(P)-dependent oxidoreductase [Tropicimonas sp. IMCC6043]|uniref:NAD(P)-dependent oxidoreductase n=1 Tax=Tropicimonas sp. IMCC6043 TaxID=2510645 RepID=UPI00101D9162|nr:NAD(P)-dependent oxidoreductase [Tropicimonas sp. IMCC6043]RYH11615.1 hydroxyacid dehydrogenase [Tropicimonas sp. IMCC6043]